MLCAENLKKETKLILFNTTFHLDSTIESDFLAWIRESFIPAALSAGLKKPLLCRIVDKIEPGCSAFALQTFIVSVDEADKWRSEYLCKLLAEMSVRWKDRALAFSTPMEVLE